MKFEEKLIKLRKENALSQEELGEKLNVTRQTISKWELGQTKPDSEKIMEIAKLFNVSTDELLNESDEVVKTKETNKDNNKDTRNTLIVIGLIAILILIVVWVGSKIIALGFISNFLGGITNKIDSITNKNDEISNSATDIFNRGSEFFDNIVDKATEEIEKNEKEQAEFKEKMEQQEKEINDAYNKVKQQIGDYDKNVRNSIYEQKAGIQSKIFLESIINQAIKDNSNGSKVVTVNYNGTTYSEASELSSLYSSLQDKKYLITYGYDSEGNVNEVTIADV